MAHENDDDIVSPTHGIPMAMSTVASKMKSVGYSTYLIDKWDACFATYSHLPTTKCYGSLFRLLGQGDWLL